MFARRCSSAEICPNRASSRDLCLLNSASLLSHSAVHSRLSSHIFSSFRSCSVARPSRSLRSSLPFHQHSRLDVWFRKVPESLTGFDSALVVFYPIAAEPESVDEQPFEFPSSFALLHILFPSLAVRPGKTVDQKAGGADERHSHPGKARGHGWSAEAACIVLCWQVIKMVGLEFGVIIESWENGSDFAFMRILPS